MLSFSGSDKVSTLRTFKLQVIIHSDDDNNDGMEHNVPFVGNVRVLDVGQRRMALPGPALVHAEDQSGSRHLRHAVAYCSVHIWNGSHYR